uniref:Uncharacterized protein n=1 Tax=Strombidium inclinatum TaxID=197538 RepID=A0A7S3IWB9_9SPIT|mmetsp:Transcript_5740/g.9128  ORF Transcript_5740/g.9128 Transcript_5740/m.9128 type:complete len:200 (+) Transcript_5740:32-631(+)
MEISSNPTLLQRKSAAEPCQQLQNMNKLYGSQKFDWTQKLNSDVSTANQSSFKPKPNEKSEEGSEESLDLSLESSQNDEDHDLLSPDTDDLSYDCDLVKPKLTSSFKTKAVRNASYKDLTVLPSLSGQQSTKSVSAQAVFMNCLDEFDGGLEAPTFPVNSRVKEAELKMKAARTAPKFEVKEKKGPYHPGRILGAVFQE